MPEHTAITQADVAHVAALASLALTPEELEHHGRDLESILGYVAELQSLDTTGVEPLTHVSELFPLQAAEPETLRPDSAQPGLPREIVMQNAPATDGAFFKVPKVIER